MRFRIIPLNIFEFKDYLAYNPSEFSSDRGQKVNVSGKHFNYTVHKKQSEFPNTGTPKQKLEHHWWPSNIFAMQGEFNFI